jgi:hypothetical protein
MQGMDEKAQLLAYERDHIRDQIESDRSYGFISDAAVTAIANHKASMKSGTQALTGIRTCVGSN